MLELFFKAKIEIKLHLLVPFLLKYPTHTCNLLLNLFVRFRASLYPCPETPQERKEMAAGVNTRIDDLQMV